jgi:hypothetical protein
MVQRHMKHLGIMFFEPRSQGVDLKKKRELRSTESCIYETVYDCDNVSLTEKQAERAMPVEEYIWDLIRTTFGPSAK